MEQEEEIEMLEGIDKKKLFIILVIVWIVIIAFLIGYTAGSRRSHIMVEDYYLNYIERNCYCQEPKENGGYFPPTEFNTSLNFS